MNDFEYTLPDGRVVTIEPGTVCSADPSVGIFSPYVEEFGVTDADGNEIMLSETDSDAVHYEISRRLAEYDPC